MCRVGHLISERQYESQRCSRCAYNAKRAADRRHIREIKQFKDIAQAGIVGDYDE